MKRHALLKSGNSTERRLQEKDLSKRAHDWIKHSEEKSRKRKNEKNKIDRAIKKHGSIFMAKLKGDL